MKKKRLLWNAVFIGSKSDRVENDSASQSKDYFPDAMILCLEMLYAERLDFNYLKIGEANQTHGLSCSLSIMLFTIKGEKKTNDEPDVFIEPKQTIREL